MKKILITMLGMVLTISVMYSQSGLKTWTENFDDVDSITTIGTPAQKWKIGALSVTSPNSLRGILPNDVGDSIVLETREYDFTNMYYVIMQFHHICKINAQDKFRIEYLIPGQVWKKVPADAYMGPVVNFSLLGFSDASYPDWQSNDAIVIPDNSWWKEETFDMSYIVQNEPAVKFRFILTRKSEKGANIAYGWLIDSLKIMANPYELRTPVVEFLDPLVKDTIYNAGPYKINAKVRTTTTARIEQPRLEYTVTEPGKQAVSHSILMTNVAGDSIWNATIPSYNAGTYIAYSITGKDTLNNEKTINSSYHIRAAEWNIYITDSIEMAELEYQSFSHPFTMSGNGENWSRTLYLYSNLEEYQTGDITMLGIAYNSNISGIVERYGSMCYMQSTTDTYLSSTGTMPDPVSDGAIRVYRGDWVSQAGWNQFIFDRPFVLPAGENLLVTWIDTSSLNVCGLASDAISWHVDACDYVASEAGYSNNNYCQGSGSEMMSRIPSTILYTGEGKKYSSSSVALSSIDNPTKETLIYGIDNPIEVTISNRGTAVLDSVTVFWQVNGGDIDSSIWKGSLPWDHKVQYNAGNFQPTVDVYDTLKIWVADPNGRKDSITNDDTLSVILFGCTPNIFERKIVSKVNGLGEFSSIDEALGIIRSCVVDRDITLVLDTGTYEQTIDLTNISDYLGQYSLTITSITGNPEDVIIRPATGNGITLNNSNNINIKAITVDISQTPGWDVSAIYFRDGCDNILIRDCHLLASRTSEWDYSKLINKATWTNKSANNISIINNLIDGGQFGIHFSGCTEWSLVYGNNIVIDSNTITNWNESGMVVSYVNLNSCSYNTIESRKETIGNMYSISVAVSLDRINGPVIGNRIKMHEYSMYTDYSTIGVSLENYSTAYTTDTGLFANNEIITHNNGTWRDFGGLFIGANTRVNVINNSIYVDGTGKEKGIFLSNSNQNSVNIRNNNIVTKNRESYAIYLAGIDNLSHWIFDYNNMVSPVFIGYTGGESHSNIASWKSVVTSDNNSVSIAPGYINVEENLKITNYNDLICPSIPPVNTDLEGKSRATATTMGCYSLPEASVNGILLKILGLRSGPVANLSDNLELVIINGGTTSINSFNIEWSIDGISQANGGITHTITLAEGETDTIPLGVIDYTLGEMKIKAWINNLGSLTDDIRADDTLSVSVAVCNTSLSGTIYISDTSLYSTIGEALETGLRCGVSGDITFALDAGVHNESIDLTNLNSYFGGHSLTITSKTGRAEDVIIRPSSGNGITLNNSDNITIQAVTVDVNLTGLSAIHFVSACTNVVIRDCRLFADSTITEQSFVTSVIYKEYETGVADSIFIINNLMHGGSYGLNFYGGTDVAYSSHVVFDSNTITNWYYNGAAPVYVNFASCSHNTILTRTENVLANTTVFRLESVNGSVIGNRIIQRSIDITRPYLIYLESYSSNPDTVLFANNEIIGYATSSSGNGGIYVGSYAGKINIINNSMYMGGTTGRGIWINSSNRNMSLNVQNNNIVTEGTTSYPIYLNSTTHLSRSTYDYNNMYSPNNVGWATRAHTTIKTWQEVVTSDKNSKSKLPDFVEVSKSLELSDYADFPCPIHPLVDKDINAYNRINMTTMGAYSAAGSFDLRVLEITRVDDELIYNQKVHVGTQIMNGSTANIDSVNFKWSINDVVQPKLYAWKPSSPLIFGQDAEVFIDTFTVSYTNEVKISIWAESVNGRRDSIAYNDTVTKILPVVPLARFIDPLVPDTIQNLSFNIYAKIMDVSGATIHAPKINLKTVTLNSIVYDTIDMIYGKDLIWVAHVPQQYYDSKVIYSLTISDTIGNRLTLTDSTVIPLVVNDSALTACNLSIVSIDKLVPDNVLCIDDYAPVRITIANAGFLDYDFTFQPVKFYLEVKQPRYFYKDTIISEGILDSAGTMVIELTDMLPIITAGQYDIKTWLENPIDIVSHDDTLLTVYVSGKFGLPVDEDFNSLILPDVFKSEETIGTYKWEVVSQGTGADANVVPYSGNGMLAFSGSRGSMSTLYTQQLDLSSAIQPNLSFWYFHDTIPCDDDMDVRITVDGGNSYTTLFSIPKYDPHYYGWKEYSEDLPPFAINQCVVLAFEAMERSLGNVTQYLDHIIINAKQEIAITDIFVPDLSVCSLEGKEWKVVLENKTAPALNYSTTPVAITLELVGTPYSFTEIRNSGILHGFTSDTVTLASGFDLVPGKYITKAYISSILGDIFMDTITIDPNYTIRIHNISSSGGPLQAEIDLRQDVTIKNTGNMPLPQLDLTLSVDADDISPAYHFTATESTFNTLAPGDSITVTFNTPYSTPWSAEYRVHALASLHCDPALISKETAISEYVDIDNIALIRIDKPVFGQIDAVGNNINIEVTLENKSDVTSYSNVNIHARIEDSKGNVRANVSGTVTEAIGTSDTKSYTFDSSYPVPEDSVYYITVFIDQQAKDNYRNDDTIRTKRTTDYNVGIESINPSTISMSQNVPNPAGSITSITYSTPASGKVIFTISSINGQVLYNKSIESELGIHSIDMNVSHLAAGIYFYSMEFNGQRITKRMSIKR